MRAPTFCSDVEILVELLKGRDAGWCCCRDATAFSAAFVCHRCLLLELLDRAQKRESP